MIDGVFENVFDNEVLIETVFDIVGVPDSVNDPENDRVAEGRVTDHSVGDTVRLRENERERENVPLADGRDNENDRDLEEVMVMLLENDVDNELLCVPLGNDTLIDAEVLLLIVTERETLGDFVFVYDGDLLKVPEVLCDAVLVMVLDDDIVLLALCVAEPDSDPVGRDSDSDDDDDDDNDAVPEALRVNVNDAVFVSAAHTKAIEAAAITIHRPTGGPPPPPHMAQIMGPIVGFFCVIQP